MYSHNAVQYTLRDTAYARSFNLVSGSGNVRKTSKPTQTLLLQKDSVKPGLPPFSQHHYPNNLESGDGLKTFCSKFIV